MWGNKCEPYFLQIIFSQLYFEANILKLGSMIPPRSRSTRWRVDSESKPKFNLSYNQIKSFFIFSHSKYIGNMRYNKQ